MGFHLFLALVVVGAATHIARLSARTADRVGETLLVWVLVGYCGLPMLAFMGLGLVHPDELAAMAGFEPGGPSSSSAPPASTSRSTAAWAR